MKRTLFSLLFAASVAFANTTTITVTQLSGVSAAPGAESAWVLANFGSSFSPDVLETFSEFPASNVTAYSTLSTGVGTFSVMPGSQPGEPGQTSGTGTNQFTILNAADSPYCCRFPLTTGGQWLDSNDITQIQLTTSLSSLFFFVTERNNESPTDLLTIQTANGTSTSFGATTTGDNLFFVAITSSGPIGAVDFLNNDTNHGFGLDDFGTAQQQSGIQTAPTPEPAAWPVAAAALIAILLFRKLKTRTASSTNASA
jgi:hypothetical protein